MKYPTVLLVGILLVSACVSQEPPRFEIPETAEPWMTPDPAEWPRIAMINRIEYSDKTHPSAACGFLLDTGDEVLAATAKHVLRP